jgi:hypothetical protein
VLGDIERDIFNRLRDGEDIEIILVPSTTVDTPGSEMCAAHTLLPSGPPPCMLI